MKNTKKFFVVVTSLMLVFAMIGCDTGTNTVTETKYVPTGGNNGPSNSASQQFYINLLDPEVNPVYVTSAVELTSAVATTKHIVVGASSGYSNALNLSVGGEGPLFAEVAGSGTLTLKAKLTLAKGAKLTVATGAAVNLKQPSGDARQELLLVKSGAIVDVKAPATASSQGGLNIEPLAEARFESAAILAVANEPGVVVVEANSANTAYGLLSIESGLKLVIPDVDEDAGVNVFTPLGESDTGLAPIFTIPAGSGALAINSTDLEVYTPTDDKTVEDALKDTPNNDVATAVKEEANEISSAFTRTANADTYVITALNGNKVSLKKVLADESLESTATDYTVLDSGILKIFTAVYEPNSVGNTDAFASIETGKSFLPYDATISAAVLGLFHITIGATPSNDLIEIKGVLTNDILTAASADNILLIDIGLPGTDNTGLPTFRIPAGALGTPPGSAINATTFTGTYGGVRLRVNKGAYMHIEADNTNHVANGENNPCDAGNFNGGCVEVMEGGSLRDGAYEGFPLGDPATILNRLGSRLAVGPEPGSDDAKARADSYAAYYSGWLIGNAADSPRIAWDSGQADGYIEVRPSELVLSAKVTVKKLVGLIYDVWFVNTEVYGETKTIAEVTIDVTGTPSTTHGDLFPNGAYKLYGQEGHKINVVKGSINKFFLQTGATTDLVSAPITITNKGTEGGTEKTAELFNPIKGYLNWPLDEEDDE